MSSEPASNPSQVPPADAGASTVAVAWLSDGRLYLKPPGAAARMIDSPFAQEILDRAARTRQRHGWKDQGMGWSFSGGRRLGALGGAGEPLPDTRRVRITGVAPGPAGNLVYVLDTDTVGGLFEYAPTEAHERRLFHRNTLRASDLSRHPHDGTLAVSLAHDDGTSNLATLAADGRGLCEVTEGDSVDEAPSWAAGAGRVLVFQSAGVGRNPHGARIALGPYAIQRLDLDRGNLETVLEADDSDYLVPRQAADGTLYFVRRPYQSHGATVSAGKVALDILLFPYRLVRAVLYFLNFFSLMFSRQPLITAGGPKEEGPDQRYLMLWGKVIDAEKALRDAKKSGGGRGLVPKTWELVRRDPQGGERVLARGVLSFDLASDGAVVYTDGSAVYHINSAGEVSQISEGKMIERVSVIG